ncbi:hypothetical protein [Eubacterium ruminantium]|uniref:hypothetical protein n=1 Tax=Eubacterium ruminantium TaxID=42322 RepID=UPI0015685E40|nr:hypothetical protein [Eubacterium ruminantium]
MKSEFINKLDMAYDLCLTEINKRKKGIDGESSIQQLKVIIPELINIKKKVIEGDLPLAENRYLESFAMAFTVWGWNMNEPTELFVLLTEINNDYKSI